MMDFGLIRKNINRCCPLFLLVFLCSQLAIAKSPYFIIPYSVENGLAQSTVYAITQDTQGFMWFGTRGGGLNRFDGHSFSQYIHDPKDSTSIPHNVVSALLPADEGHIWVGTANGICLFSIHEAKSKVYKETVLEDERENFFYSFFKTKEGDFYAGSVDGLYLYNKESDSFKLISEEYRGIRTITQGPEGNIWFNSVGRLVCMSQDQQNFKVFEEKASDLQSLKADNILSLAFDRHDRLWIGTRNSGVNIMENIQVGKFKQYNTENSQLPSNDIRTLHEDQDGEIWIGTKKGVAIYQHFDQSFEIFQSDNYDKNSLSQNSVYSFYEDQNQNLWVGTWSGGVNLFSNNAQKFQAIQNHFIKNKRQPIGSVSTFWVDQEGTWIGSENQGLIFQESKGSTLSTKQFFPKEHIKTLWKDHNEDFWVGTFHGLKFKEKNSQHFRDILEGEGIYDLIEYPKGKIWASTLRYIYRIDKADFSIKRYSKEEGKLSSTYNRGGIFHLDRQGKLWVGAQKGLMIFDQKSDSFLSYEPKKNSNHLLFKSFIYDITEDQEHRIWIGTQNGLFALNLENNEILSFNKNEGLSSHMVHGVLYDAKENTIWASTSNGLNQVYLSDFKINAFSSSEGLQGEEFNRSACFISKDGQMFFGGTKGYNAFNPYDIQTNRKAPEVILDQISFLGSRNIHKTDSYKLYGKEKIEIPYGESAFSINYTAINYSQPKQITYALKISGHFNDWIQMGNQRQVHLAKLEPGSYEMSIKAANEDGVWGKPSTLELVILPPIWRAWWANLLYVLMITIIIQFIYKEWKVRQHFKNDLLVEKMSKEKMEYINQLKINFFTNVSHELRTPLSLIIGPLERIIKKGDDIPASHDYLALMLKNAKHLMQLVDELLEFRKVQSGKQRLKVQEIPLVKFINEISLSFEARAQNRDIELTTSGKDDLTLWADRAMFQKVIHNILSNAFKHTPKGGKIRLNVEKISSYNVKISISDTGVGMSKEMISQIFEYYSHKDSTLGEDKGVGIGMALSKEIIELHQGEIKVESEPDKGTTFHLILSLGKTHFEQLDGVEFLEVALDTEKNQEEEEGKTKEADSSIPKILVVDDNAEFRTFLRDGLKEKYTIIEAQNGVEAFEKAQKEQPQLILTDIMMPDMDGYEFCDKVKSHYDTDHMPVIFLSAKDSTESQKEALQKGGDAYISKPFDWDYLELTVETTLQKFDQLKQRYLKDLLNDEEKKIGEMSEDEKFTVEVKRIMEEYLSASELSVETFCKEIGMSRSNLNIKFKSIIGKSPNEYIKYYRMQKAAALLLTGKNSVIEVVYSVGFKSPSYFTKCFKETFGKLPSEYTEMYQKEEAK
ncbi:two-component regulator propeller domain-containing protein [Sediminitomix flava]|uniref:histidine kinase n=1 Tax=Sediminitomix flava TaxID=379075 RepID=A0A316A4R6_SEDFL|nr:two-component regulator propeller domain-containing protein [Sediminitomix flava]PWJ44757.1 two component regulator with propeller domain [Sediminitomix flava]